MVKTFSNKAIEALWRDKKTKGLPSQCVNKIGVLLYLLDTSNSMNDLEAFRPKYRTHILKKKPYENFWSFDITGNYRIVARFEDGHFYEIDFLDTH